MNHHNRSHWGHPIWESIHTLAANYDGSQQSAQGFRMYMGSLSSLLPCAECRTNLMRHLQADLPLTEEHFNNRDTLFLWTYRLHDIINREIGEKRGVYKQSPAYEIVYSYYMGAGRCPHCGVHHQRR